MLDAAHQPAGSDDARRQWTRIVEGMSDALIVLDKDERCSHANGRALRLLGKPLEALLGRPVWDDLAEGLSEPFRQAHHEAREKDVPVARAAFSPQLDRWLEVRCDPAVDGMALFVADVTEQHYLLRELQRRTRALAALSTCTRALVRTIDEQEWVQEVCRICVDLGGYRMAWVGYAEDDEAQTVRPVAQIGFADGYLDRVHISWADTERGRGPTGTAIRTGQPSVSRDILNDPRMAPWRAAAGERGYASSIALPMAAGERVLGALNLYAVERDAFRPDEVALLAELANDLAYGIEAIRERKARALAEEQLRASEARFRLLAENAQDMIYRYRLLPEPGWEYVSPACLKITGYSPEAFYADAGLWPRQRQPEDRGATTAGAPLERWRARDGRVVRVEIRQSPVLDEAGRTVALEGVARDVTEHERLQAQLLQAQKMDAMGRLAGGIAHDFNNLLTVIHGYGRFLLDEMPAKSVERGEVAEIVRAAERAAGLTRQLLAFSRSQVLEMRVLNPNAIVEGMGKMLGRIIGEDVRLHTLLVQDPGSVRADPGQIEQVLLNLAVNARDAMPDGGTIALSTANVTADEAFVATRPGMRPGSYVALAVGDTGTGMTSEVQSHLFEPFFTTKGVGRGTGLGLATVYGIVKQSGGNIYVASEPGRGSTFTIYLPRVYEATTTPEVTEDSWAGGREAILLVEDEPGVRTLATRMLSKLGYTVLEAANPAEALSICRERSEPIDLLLTDMVMPEMSGRLLVEKVREIRPSLRVLFMSGYTDDTLLKAGKPGADTPWLPKPFTIASLARRVRHVLDQP